MGTMQGVAVSKLGAVMDCCFDCLSGTELGIGWALLDAQNERSSLLPVFAIARLE
jgi:hypothetical protein